MVGLHCCFWQPAIDGSFLFRSFIRTLKGERGGGGLGVVRYVFPWNKI